MAKIPDKFHTISDTYTLTGVIGEGGAGRVFDVENSSGQSFAIKCLRPDLLTTEKRKRFRNELAFCERNPSRNIVKIVDSGLVEWESNRTPFYVMPRYSATLRALMNDGIAPDRVLHIFGQILDGVDAAHKQGVIHRDLKPENILFAADEELFVVADFGIAHFEEDLLETKIETRRSDKLLNIQYAAPEQRAKGREVDSRADIYALGQMLNEMFTGSVPEGSGHLTIESVAAQFAYLDRLVDQMRRQNPHERPQTIFDVKKTLIGHKNEFINILELDKVKQKVIHASEIQPISHVEILSAEWDRGILSLTLNRAPEYDWIQVFQFPLNYSVPGVSFIIGLSPPQYNFNGLTVTVMVEERLAQTAIDQFKIWSPSVTKRYNELLAESARRQEIEKRRKIEQEIADQESKMRVSSSLKI